MIFDFYFRNCGDTTFNPYKDNKYYNKKIIKVIKQENFILCIASHTKEMNYFESEEKIYFVYGNIFNRLNYKDYIFKFDIKNFKDKIEENELNINSFKGNFAAFIIDKRNNEVKIYNSQLGIKNIYYRKLSEGYIISSNLNFYKYDKFGYNNSAITQHLEFTFPLNNETFVNDVYKVEPGEIISITSEKLLRKKYYEIKNLFLKNDNDFDIYNYTDIFNKCVYQRAAVSDTINVSLTGGFDGRTILSSLLAQQISFSAYSFGIEGGENTLVPINIKNNTGIQYKPIYLNSEYEKNYYGLAANVIYNSDGISFNERSNYPFAFEKLSHKSNIVISGLLGGETLRPLHLAVDYMNKKYYDTFYKNLEYTLLPLYKKIFPELYNENFIKNFIYEYKLKIKNAKDEIPNHLIYLWDLMNTGFRMYYGTEIHSERIYAENLTPYYDIDLLEYLFSTDYTSIYKKAFKDSKLSRWRGQLIYAKIMDINCPQLNNIHVDRGYKPKHLLHSYTLPFIPYQNYIRNKTKHLHPDFKVMKWSKIFFEEFMNNLSNYNNYYDRSELLSYYTKIKESQSENDVTLFSRFLSLIFWLHS